MVVCRGQIVKQNTLQVCIDFIQWPQGGAILPLQILTLEKVFRGPRLSMIINGLDTLKWLFSKNINVFLLRLLNRKAVGVTSLAVQLKCGLFCTPPHVMSPGD